MIETFAAIFVICAILLGGLVLFAIVLGFSAVIGLALFEFFLKFKPGVRP